MRRFILAAAMSTGFALPVLAEPTIETARGPVDLGAVPQKLVVMDVAAIDTLQAMEVPIIGIPGKVNLSYVKTDGLTDVGTLFEPNLETIAGLAPDLIIIGGRSAAKFDDVAQVGKAVDMTIGTDLMKEAEARIATYGALFGKEDKAAEMKAALDAKTAKLQEAAKDKGSLLVVLTNGPKMSAYGKGTRFGWLHDVTGLPEAAPNLKTEGSHGEAISPEFIAEKNPDWLFVLDRGVAVGQESQSAGETLKTPLIEGTNAFKNGHVVYLPASEMYIGGGGYQAMSIMLDAMTEALAK
ncbi:siderophore ABC transporter substrate-binding protein [Paracoccus aminophilus]|uniref:ABC Fe+3 siderophore transporter, periplasmic substrate-binding protein n=1 Tax=Paracoccus aminophilus JCM 7686 TaxID=1367847 RepID=S5YIS8_PARAH|nr:siderophore ABC transporter substrate-binding protein [Paracoccus aminophilus]AGT11378.1 ABC Fe+3 siderophore transporter, periplasmic substrate-binding protein [Paracoccus aminophilus JCM 7686]